MSPFWCHRIAMVMGPWSRVIGPPGDRVLPPKNGFRKPAAGRDLGR
jgi:hypothetical protein